MHDSLAFLGAADVDWEIQREVVMQARKLRVDERREELKAVIEAIGVSVGNHVAKVVGGMFK